MNQESRLKIFKKLRKILQKYEPPLVAKDNFEGRYDLWTTKTVEIAGKERHELQFAAIIIQSGYVGFYFMPLYVKPEFGGKLDPLLSKMLKGKTCLHIKMDDNEIYKRLEKLVAEGFKLYKSNGWV